MRTTTPLPSAAPALRHRPKVLALGRAPRVDRLLAALRDRGGLVALDSAAGRPRRWSLVAADPIAGADGSPLRPPSSLGELAAFVALLARDGGDAVPGPFAGGFLGALAYDHGVLGESQRLPRDPWELPPIAGGLYVDFVAIEHAPRGARAWLVLGDDPGDGRPSIAAREREWRAAVERALEGRVACEPFALDGELRRLVPAAEHRRRVQLARGAIARGDYYQANLAHPFEARTRGAALDLYLRLRRANPAPYMGFLDFGAGALLSASPELLLELDPLASPRLARTRPIKGTIARAADPAEDRRRAAALLASEKDRAELAMIVDLERNDLGRVSRAGGVRVEGFPTLRSYANVHHLTADVVGELAPEVGAADVLASLFPGGSVTGAPKLAAMAAIAELEGEGRGFFTGSLGALDVRGGALFNVLIRTVVLRRRPELGPDAGEARYHVGGGITWSSDPAREDEETLVKGARLARALGAQAPA